MNRFFLLCLYSFSLILIIHPLFPSLQVFYLAPLLVMSFYRKDKISCLWISIGCGLLIDLLAAQTHFGLYALNYCLTTYLLYSYKRHFFEDRLTTIPLMTYFFSLFSTIIHVCLLYMLGQSIHISWSWIVEDLFVMPLYDSVYAGIAFTLPSLFLPKAPLKRKSSIISLKGRL